MMLALVSNLTISFGSRAVFTGLNLELPSSGINMLLGRSGSGKTTFLRAFNRLNEEFAAARTQGQIQLRLGKAMQPIYDPACYGAHNPVLPSIEALRCTVAMVFQNPNVLPMSIEQNIVLPLQVHTKLSSRECREKAQDALEAAALWHEVRRRLSERAETLSGGQQQRLCLARALALEPEILLLDEPTASLDPASTKAVETLIERLAANYGILMVSHGLEQAARLGSHFLAFAADGKVTRLQAADLGNKTVVDHFFSDSSW